MAEKDETDLAQFIIQYTQALKSKCCKRSNLTRQTIKNAKQSWRNPTRHDCLQILPKACREYEKLTFT